MNVYNNQKKDKISEQLHYQDTTSCINQLSKTLT